MSNLRKNHLVIVGVLFAIAGVLYIVGLGSGAFVVSVAAAIVEATAWIALGNARAKESSPSAKQ